MLREVPMRMFSSLTERKKRFERAKVNSRCFHWFPAAMLESLNSILNSVTRITRVRNNFCTFIYYVSTIFQFLDSVY